MKINETRSSQAGGSRNNKNNNNRKKNTSSLSDTHTDGENSFSPLEERKLQALLQRGCSTRRTHTFLWREKLRREKKNVQTARGRVHRGHSRVSRLQEHSLSQALLLSSKLGMGVFSTLCSPSRCFLLSGLSEGRETGDCTTHSLSFHPAVPPFLHSDT